MINPLRSTSRRLATLVSLSFLLAFIVLGGGVFYAVSAMLDKDARDVVRAQSQALVELRRDAGGPALLAEVRDRTEAPDDPDGAYAVVDRHGRRLAGAALDLPPGFAAGVPAIAVPAWYEYADANTDDNARTIARAVRLPDDGVLLVGLRARAQDGFRRLMLRVALAAGLAAAALGLLLGWSTARWVASRLDAFDRTAARVGEGAMALRVRTDDSGDVFDRLAQRFNGMLDRIEVLLAGVRHATDHIAHDLRTPLSRLRNRLDLLRSDVAPAQRASLDAALGETDQLLATFGALLRLARIEAAPVATDAPDVALKPLVDDAVELYAPSAAERGIHIDVHATPATLAGDADQLFQMLLNLLDNAVKYSPDGGRIGVTLAALPQGIRIEVTDAGAGIPEPERQRVFDRFERLESHRGSPGSGLGLSLVRAVVRHHGGQVRLLDAGPGLRVQVDFPRR